MKTLQEHIELLREYNRWRRGEDENQTMPCPRQVGRAIDAVCDLLDAGDGLQITIKASSWSKLAKERDEAREALAAMAEILREAAK